LEGQVAAQVLLLLVLLDHQVLFLVLLLLAQAAVELLDKVMPAETEHKVGTPQEAAVALADLDRQELPANAAALADLDCNLVSADHLHGMLEAAVQQLLT
jgi:hypothetical protein